MAKKRTVRRNPEEVRATRIKHKRRHKALFGVICVLLVCAVAVLATTVFFRVSEIKVTGETRYTAEQLIHTSGIAEGDNLFFLGGGAATRSLENTYPYLDEVRLKRHLPGTLEIAVTERTPRITAQLEDKTLFYIDDSGKVLEKLLSLDDVGSTILVTGVNSKELVEGQFIDENTDSKIAIVLHMLAVFDEYGLRDKIISVDITELFNVEINYDNHYTLELGTVELGSESMERLEHKIQFLLAILKRDDLAVDGIIDLTSDKEARYRPYRVERTEEPAEQAQSTEEETGDAGEETDNWVEASGETAEDDSAESETPEEEAAEETGDEG